MPPGLPATVSRPQSPSHSGQSPGPRWRGLDSRPRPLLAGEARLGLPVALLPVSVCAFSSHKDTCLEFRPFPNPV